MNKRIIKIVLALALALLALVLAVSSCAPQAVLSGEMMPAESAEPEQPEAEPSAAPEDEPAVIQPEEAPSEAAPPAEEPAPEEPAAPIETQEASGPDPEFEDCKRVAQESGQPLKKVETAALNNKK